MTTDGICYGMNSTMKTLQDEFRRDQPGHKDSENKTVHGSSATFRVFTLYQYDTNEQPKLLWIVEGRTLVSMCCNGAKKSQLRSCITNDAAR
jgi:hypothetical protein